MGAGSVDGVEIDADGDALGRLQAYRLAVKSFELAGADAARLAAEPHFTRVAAQLLDAVGSIGANIAEGYSRATHAERNRFFDYAIGSVREASHWYRGCSITLGADIVAERLALLTSQRRLLIAMVRNARRTAKRNPFEP